MSSGMTAVCFAASRAFLISSRDLGFFLCLILRCENLYRILRFTRISSGGGDGDIPEVAVQKLPSCFEIRISVNSEEGRYSYIISIACRTSRGKQERSILCSI